MTKSDAISWAQSQANIYATAFCYWKDPVDGHYKVAPLQAAYVPNDESAEVTIVRPQHKAFTTSHE